MSSGPAVNPKCTEAETASASQDITPDEAPPLSAGEVAAKVGVAPTDAKASPQQRMRAYRWFRRLLSIAQILDPIKIPNSYVNFQCLWWKAITGNDRTSPLQDGGLAYDLLPPVTRLAVSTPLASLYPRFHHGNVELRTKYLDTAMDQIVKSLPPATKRRIRLVLMGGGYDLRSIRMALRHQDEGCTMDLVEVDLPHVIEAKKIIFQQRLLKRRPELKALVDKVRMYPLDLNVLEQVESVVKSKILLDDTTEDMPWFTIFVFEAVLVYLDDGIPGKLLSLLAEALQQHGQTGAISFADTLSNIEGTQEYQAREALKQCGWDLKDWLTKPGKTRNLGWAALEQN